MPPRPPRPLWRRAFDRAERLAGQPLEDAVRTTTFTDLLVLSLRLQRAMWRGAERGSRTVLHLCNLPARTDVDRLSRNVSALRNELRAISARLDEDARER